ncbi:hypothetical protein J2T15_005502 [Paenibacillus harenae]|uniref:Uncharacterized protein n=1 Tax=Paenibacillus harenae TaxID=306543 RepID=A0ABT9U8R8_PAEHA|nr:hypothetical protein [Paenibacillus harenae]
MIDLENGDFIIFLSVTRMQMDELSTLQIIF